MKKVSPLFAVLCGYIFLPTCTGTYLISFQTTDMRSAESYARYEDTLPEMESFTISFRIKINYERPETVFISYAVSDLQNNVIRIDYAYDTIRFIIDGNIASTKFHLLLREWHAFTFVMDLPHGDWALFIDGTLALRASGDKKFQKMNNIPGKGVLILGQDQDSLGGGFQAGQSFCGDLTEFYIWDRKLSLKDLEGKHNFSTQTEGMVLNWLTAPWTLFGDTAKLKVSSDDVSLHSGFTRYIVVAAMTSFKSAVKFCYNLEGKLVAPVSDEETKMVFDLTKAYFNSCYDIASLYLWLGYTDQEREGEWVDATTGAALPFPGSWGLFEPNGNTRENCAALYYHRQEGGVWSDYSCRDKDLLCFACELTATVELHLSGLCQRSDLDTEYTFAGTQNGRPVFSGRFATKIFFDNSKNVWFIQHSGIQGVLKDEILPIGTKLWVFNKSPCPGGNNVLTLTLSACKSKMFTCNDGSCIDLAKRCDQRVNCNDRSDEDNCAVLEVPTGYRSEIAPANVNLPLKFSYTIAPEAHSPFQGNESSGQDTLSSSRSDTPPLDVYISVDIQAVPSINTVDMVFTVGFQMTLEWSDSRLTFHNLKNKSDLNALSFDEKRAIWIPIINFGYAVGNKRSYMDKEVRGYAIKMGTSIIQDEKKDIYNGSSVLLTITSKYDITYVCDFDLTLYPFDTQICAMRFNMLSTTKDKVRLVPKGVAFNGKRQLIECIIGDVKMIENDDVESSFSSVEVRMELIRESGFHLLTTYLPTSLMIIIAYLTFFFRMQNFTDRIMVSLTSLLVLSSLLSQTSETMPKTSYFKMVDIWLFSCILTIFIIILFHTASIYITTKEPVSKHPLNTTDYGQVKFKLSTTPSKENLQYITPEKILEFGKIVLPITLLLFNIFYWSFALGD